MVNGFHSVYHLESHLGSGQFGCVYRFRDQNLNKVAIKVFKELQVSEEELKIAKEVCSKGLKGIVPLLDYGKIDDAATAERFRVEVNSYFIVYDYLEMSLE